MSKTFLPNLANSLVSLSIDETSAAISCLAFVISCSFDFFSSAMDDISFSASLSAAASSDFLSAATERSDWSFEM